ncbi:MAG: ribosomal L7Ae/L30e/S12e/Gadd45 family protein [Clostridia bacterium]|nr:ribosomal L7Ae/L30e/S12e/Gadd45 family protein [Clostridia bacterium]
MNNDKALMSLCLARKAGRLVCGTGPCMESVRYGRAKLVIIACDVSAPTLKKITDKTAFHNVPAVCTEYSRSRLGAAFGCGICACAAVTDDNFVRMFTQANNKQAEEN